MCISWCANYMIMHLYLSVQHAVSLMHFDLNVTGLIQQFGARGEQLVAVLQKSQSAARLLAVYLANYGRSPEQ